MRGLWYLLTREHPRAPAVFLVIWLVFSVLALFAGGDPNIF